SKKFQQDDRSGNNDWILGGTYSLDELKAAVDKSATIKHAIKYAFADFGNDGADELILRFESKEQDFNSWTGIIKQTASGLVLCDYYEDNSRAPAVLYASGYLCTGGAMGAGGEITEISRFGADGRGTRLFMLKKLYGTAAASAVYDLKKNVNAMKGDYSSIMGSSRLVTRVHSANGKVKIAAEGWSRSTSVRKKEKALIRELVKLGAKEVSKAEMDKLFSLSKYQKDEIVWQDWDADAPSKGEQPLTADYAPQELLDKCGAYHEFIADTSEYQTKVVFRARSRVTNVRVLALNFEDVTEEGEVSFSAQTLYTLPELTPEKPLVVALLFAGGIPNMGIACTSNGTEHTYSLSMSGMDSSILLDKANIVKR
ncbi:MAG: hypothetical protein SOZ52_04320, partial [Pyramidobacter sp.]|nr:hypothetical protein [Pyramidobacter sp.]